MWSGIDPSDRALYRLVKGGETGLNLRLSDLFDTDVVVPGLKEILKSFFTGNKLKLKIKASPATLVRSLMRVQDRIDKEVEKKIKSAQSKANKCL